MTIHFVNQGNEGWFVLLGIIIFGAGLLPIFAKDLMWDLTAFNNRVEGRRSERTGDWETFQTFGGIVTSGLGVVLIAISLWSAFTPPAPPPLTMADCPMYDLNQSAACQKFWCHELDSKAWCGYD